MSNLRTADDVTRWLATHGFRGHVQVPVGPRRAASVQGLAPSSLGSDIVAWVAAPGAAPPGLNVASDADGDGLMVTSLAPDVQVLGVPGEAVERVDRNRTRIRLIGVSRSTPVGVVSDGQGFVVDPSTGQVWPLDEVEATRDLSRDHATFEDVLRAASHDDELHEALLRERVEGWLWGDVLIAAAVALVTEPADLGQAFEAARRGDFPDHARVVHSWFRGLGVEELLSLLSYAETAAEQFRDALEGVVCEETDKMIQQANMVVLAASRARMQALVQVLADCTDLPLEGIRGQLEIADEFGERVVTITPRLAKLGDDRVYVRMARGSFDWWWSRLAPFP